MKLLTLRAGPDLHPAVLIGTNVLDLVRARDAIPLARWVPSTMRALIAGGAEGLQMVARIADSASQPALLDQLHHSGALHPFADATIGPVVPDPSLMLSGSMNSRGHVAEMNDIPPDHPCAFHKAPSAIAASGDPIVPPPDHGHMLDWEGEFCAVIGTRCHGVTQAEAETCILGYTLTNDVSAREFVMPFVTAKGAAPTAQAWERNVLGKNFPGFAPIGPVIATRDEFTAPVTYHIETLVNGQVMQSSTQEDLVFNAAEMIAYFSAFYVFQPGDIVSLGSPPGVGMARKPPIFLQPGDTVQVRCDAIGTLTNRIAGG